MLQLPLVFTEDQHATDLIRSYLTERILDLVDEVMDNYIMDTDMEEPYGDEYDYMWLLKDPEFVDEISDLFPEDFPEKDMVSSFFSLKEALEAEEERPLSPALEYVVCKLIVEEIMFMPEETLIPMEGREYVYHALRQEEERDRREGMMVFDFDEDCDFAWTDELRQAKEEGRAVPSAFYILSHLEDMLFYPMLLFRMDEGEMAQLFLDGLLAEMEMEEDDEDGDWEEDGDDDDILPFDLTWNKKSYLHGGPGGDDDLLPF